VQGVAWRKSRQSMNNGNCVEVAGVPNGIVVRDSANEAGAMLRYSAQAWRAFLTKAKTGKFDVKTELNLRDREYSVARIRLSRGKSLDRNGMG
jgi:hypothetical protein